jgi:very-short-patch-repair endonuclease
VTPARLGTRAEDTLAQALTLCGPPLSEYEREYQYALPRKFRADFAWPAVSLLVEVQGGIYSGQAHGSISGILRDNERLNAATLAGFTVLRFTPDDIEDEQLGETLATIEAAIRWAR